MEILVAAGPPTLRLYANAHSKCYDWPVESSTTVKLARFQKNTSLLYIIIDRNGVTLEIDHHVTKV